MNYNLPLMEEEVTSYIVSSDDPLDVLDCRPGMPIFKVKEQGHIHPFTTLRQWWEPIEDEL
jgi:hypothetical protein